VKRRKVSAELEEVRRIAAMLEGRTRWPRDVPIELVRRLDKAGLVPAAIADELGLSDTYVMRLLNASGTVR
jgi:hypothetical protein